MREVVVADLQISVRTAEKLLKRGLDAEDVSDAIEDVPGLRGKFEFDPERGWRLKLLVKIEGLDYRVVLYPTDDDEVWNLGSAYPV